MSLGGVIRELIVKIKTEVEGSGFTIMEDRLTNIRNIMSDVVTAANNIKEQVLDFVRAGANIESMELKFGTLAKSVELGIEKLKELNYFAATTPFTLPEVRKNTSMLIAMGIELEDVIPTMKMLGDITAGLPNLSLERLALNFGQVKTQTYLTGRELRDFAVGGIPLLQGLEESLSKSGGEIREMIAKKQVSFKMVEDAFKKMTSSEGSFYRMLDKMAESTEGLYNNIKVSWQLIQEGVGKDLVENVRPLLRATKDFLYDNRETIIHILSKSVKALLSLLITVYDILFKIGIVFIPLAGAISDVIGTFFDWIAALLSWIAKWATFIYNLEYTLPIIKALTYALIALAAGFVTVQIVGFINAMTAGASIVAIMTASVVALTQGLFAAGVALSSLLFKALVAITPFLLIGLAIAGVVLLLQSLYKYFDSINNDYPIESAIGNAIDYYAKKFEVSKERVKQFIDGLERLMTPLTAIIAMIKSAFGEGDFVTNYMNDKNVQAMHKRWQEVADGVKSIWLHLRDQLVEIWDSLPDKLEKSLNKLQEVVKDFFTKPLTFNMPFLDNALTLANDLRTRAGLPSIDNKAGGLEKSSISNSQSTSYTTVSEDNRSTKNVSYNYFKVLEQDQLEQIKNANSSIDTAILDAQGAQ